MSEMKHESMSYQQLQLGKTSTEQSKTEEMRKITISINIDLSLIIKCLKYKKWIVCLFLYFANTEQLWLF